MIIGVDPGLTGALALLHEEEIIRVWDMPTTAKTHGKGNEVNAYLLNDIMADALTVALCQGEDLTAMVEQVSARPGDGKVSAFGFGRSFGTIEGVLAGQGVPVRYVTPQRWKKMFNLVGKDKDAARSEVIRRWPEHSETFKRKKDIGRADATLIAAYGVAA